MAEIKRCYGISTGTGYLVGAGGTGKTPELDNMVKEAAEALKDTFNVDVIIRFNTNRRSGGAYIADHEMSDKIGIGVGQFNSVLRRMVPEQRNALSERECRKCVENPDQIEVYSCLSKEFLKGESKWVISTHEFRDVDSITEALEWIKNGTNEKMTAYIEKLREEQKTNESERTNKAKGA